MKRLLSAGIILLSCCAAAMAGPITVTDNDIMFMILEADLLAPPGGAASWQFRVSNSSTQWVTINSFDFSPGPSSIGSFSFDGPGPGFPLGPGSPAATGTWGTVHVDPLAVIGAKALGSLDVNYGLYVPVDPNDPDTWIWTYPDTLTIGNASVEVSDAAAVPEPATGVLLGAGVALLWLNRRRG